MLLVLGFPRAMGPQPAQPLPLALPPGSSCSFVETHRFQTHVSAGAPHAGCASLLGYCYRVQQQCTVSQLWRLEAQDQGLGGRAGAF